MRTSYRRRAGSSSSAPTTCSARRSIAAVATPHRPGRTCGPLLNAIADGTFGIMKRPASGGKGLSGVAKHDPDYYNPATDILEANQ